MRFVANTVARTVKLVLTPVLLRSGVTRKIHGVPVTVVTDAASVAALFETVDRGLALIQQYDPRRHRRLCRDIGRILVYEWPLIFRTEGFYSRRLRMVQLNATALHEYGSAAWVSAALVLVHEATHARIQSTRPGYAAQPERDRVREERVCKEAELEFVRKLPDPGLLETKVLKELGALDQVYSDAARARGSRDAIAEVRRELRRLWSAFIAR